MNIIEKVIGLKEMYYINIKYANISLSILYIVSQKLCVIIYVVCIFYMSYVNYKDYIKKSLNNIFSKTVLLVTKCNT